MKGPKTLLDKVWEAHVVQTLPGHPSVLYIDLHMIHEVTSPQAFAGLRARGLKVRRPERVLATMDHATPTYPHDQTSRSISDAAAAAQLAQLEANCEQHGIVLFRAGSPENGIVHVVGPERGRTQPGMTIVCGDSHTSTHGAFGALAFGIGTTEVQHVLATQCLLQRKPAAYEVVFENSLPSGVGAKDMALALIAAIATDGGTGHAFEFRGQAVAELEMEGRMTLCNMSIEAGARAGIIAPDEKTYRYLKGCPEAPQGVRWDRSLERWRTLYSDSGATFAKRVTIDASRLRPMVTFGTSPEMAIPVDETIPVPRADSAAGAKLERALRYMGLSAGQPIAGTPVNVAFVGSCTNGRLSDLREAAAILRGRKVAEGVRLLVVPGSEQVKREAEAEGLHEVVLAAGGQWRTPGCSMCIAMNGDQLAPGERAISTSNRNFEGRQGPGGQTMLASPASAAAAAVCGHVVDPRSLITAEASFPALGGGAA